MKTGFKVPFHQMNVSPDRQIEHTTQYSHLTSLLKSDKQTKTQATVCPRTPPPPHTHSIYLTQ